MIHEMKTHIWTSSTPIERVAKNEGFQREFRDLHANKKAQPESSEICNQTEGAGHYN